MAVTFKHKTPKLFIETPVQRQHIDLIATSLLAAIVVLCAYKAFWFLAPDLTWSDIATTLWQGFLTMLRVFILIALASIVWVPIGVIVGLRPPLARVVQPIAQFLAAFPTNLVFPVAVFAILRFHLNAEIWLSFLMILGTQWYILFNVIAGASAIPSEMRAVGENLKIRGWLWWKKIALPAIFPFYVTGALTASGGSWNASIAAEVASWGEERVRATGLGAYITDATNAGDYHRIILGVVMMSFYVLLINRLVWRPLYYYAERKFRLE
jgi:NitT/TauT family transport system permease protein